MTITEIKRQKNRPNRLSIFIDNRFAFGLDETDLPRCGLTEESEGLVLSEADYDKIFGEVVYAKARDLAIKFLEFRARTRAEVAKKLSDDEFGDDAAERVLAALEKYGYIDDEKFCVSFAHDARAINGFGNERIRRELRFKGVESAVVDEFFDSDDFDEVGAAVRLLEKKYRRSGFPSEEDKSEFYKEKRKATDFLARKGYGFREAAEAFNVYIGDEYE